MRTVVAGALLVIVGLPVALLSVNQLGIVRAVQKWPSALRPRLGRGTATFGAMLGIALVAAGLAALTFVLELRGLARDGFAAGVAVVSVAVGIFAAAKLADRVELNALIRTPAPLYRTTAPASVGRDQSATVRHPGTSPSAVADAAPVTSARIGAPYVPLAGAPSRNGANQPVPTPVDPSVPDDAQPGWVYQDGSGGWFLAVRLGPGFRLVRLPEFDLPPIGSVRPPLSLAGSVELSVWPIEAPDELADLESASGAGGAAAAAHPVTGG